MPETQELLDEHAERVAPGQVVFPSFGVPADLVTMAELRTRTSFEALVATGKLYLHKKGGLYFVHLKAKCSEDPGREITVYEHLAPNEQGYWTRPTAEFNEEGRFFRIIWQNPPGIAEDLLIVTPPDEGGEPEPEEPNPEPPVDGGEPEEETQP